MRGTLALAVLSALLLIAFQPAHAQSETVLYSFGNQSGDGEWPIAGLIMDKKGNLYGTTSEGGVYGYGTVFELSGTGTETVLYSFGSQFGDGYEPTSLIMDRKGNLYGTTILGGTYGNGMAFKLVPPAKKSGAWTETVLHNFGSQSGDGSSPCPVIDDQGNLYGTTYRGGAYGYGTVFELSPTGTETVLYSFGGQPDGANSSAGLIMDKEGSFYGTTYDGGAYGYGTVFELSSTGTETVLYSFGSQSGDGANPYAGLIMARKGNLYGTTVNGGVDGEGTVFELSAAGKETVLYSFTDGPSDGKDPYAGLVMDGKGNLYGATLNGPGTNHGAVFELSPGRKGGAWTFTSLHAFDSGTGDGLFPYGTLILDKEGNLYGTTFRGGANNEGTVFKVTP